MASMGGYIFLGTGAYGVHYSSNNGDDWSSEWTYNTIDGTIYCLAVSGGVMFAGTDANGVYVSSDGFTWVKTSLGNYDVRSLAISGSTIYAGTWANGIYKSTDSGFTWAPCGMTGINVTALAILGNYVFAGTNNNATPKGIYISTNGGITWNQSSLNNKVVSSFAVIGSKIYAGTYSFNPSGVYVSTNNGTNWTITGLNTKLVNTVFAYNGKLCAGIYNEGMYYSSNAGTTWTAKNEGFASLPSVYSFLVANGYIFAGAYAYSFWRRPLSEVIGIQNISSEIPSAYSLSQNYPNPFNPSTVMRFQLSVVGLTTLRVYDLMGREVATLVNEKLQPGTYETTFNGNNLSSGTYFYKLTSGDFTATKRLTLIK
jgi:Secretion system C-terminal sorting domain